MRFEEFQIGQVFRTAPYTVTLDEMLSFAARFDPHAYHLDEERAKRGLFGGIVGSGMHSMAIINAEWVKLGILDDDMRGGMGIEAKWLAPVRPNDTIFADVLVANLRELPGDQGIVTLEFTGYNQRGDVWAKVKTRVIVAGTPRPSAAMPSSHRAVTETAASATV
jgi:acyl dehydratase